jgi:tRNA U34 5-carboxymethylaminomethyl modifying GTPase MnmE/TrmE
MMKRSMVVVVGGVVLVLAGLPNVGQAQLADSIQLTNNAIVELSDTPGLGKRTTVDPLKRWGSDVGVIDSATAKFKTAWSKAKSAGVDKQALDQLELAMEYGQAGEHKEARLSAQGALFLLCQAHNGQGPGCDKVSEFGSYTAP